MSDCRPSFFKADAWMITACKTLDRAVMLHQIIQFHQRNADRDEINELDGKYWFDKPIKSWEKEFFFLSKNTIKRNLEFFKKAGIILIRQDNSYNRINFYCLNKNSLKGIRLQQDLDLLDETIEELPITQNGSMEEPNTDGSMQRPKMGPCEEPKMGPCTKEKNKEESIITPIVPKGTKLKRQLGFTEAGSQVWNAYAKAYYRRYETEPIADTQEKKNANTIAKKVSIDEAIAITSFYLTLENQWYLTQSHDIRWLCTQFNSVRAQMLSGKKVTASQARVKDRSTGNSEAVKEAMDIINRRKQEKAYEQLS